jgi:hypothetical protein
MFLHLQHLYSLLFVFFHHKPSFILSYLQHFAASKYISINNLFRFLHLQMGEGAPSFLTPFPDPVKNTIINLLDVIQHDFKTFRKLDSASGLR